MRAKSLNAAMRVAAMAFILWACSGAPGPAQSAPPRRDPAGGRKPVFLE